MSYKICLLLGIKKKKKKKPCSVTRMFSLKCSAPHVCAGSFCRAKSFIGPVSAWESQGPQGSKGNDTGHLAALPVTPHWLLQPLSTGGRQPFTDHGAGLSSQLLAAGHSPAHTRITRVSFRPRAAGVRQSETRRAGSARPILNDVMAGGDDWLVTPE